MSRTLRATLFALALLAALGFAYAPALHGTFVWDDDSWTTKEEPLLKSFAGLETMWRKPTSLQQYYPLAATSFWADYRLWGFRTFPYHVENLLLHFLSALLLWALLRRLGVPGAWLAAAVFALHPVMAESVAWITERKNCLSMALFLGSLLAYERFSGFGEREGAERRWGAYALALVLFLAALLAKTTTFCLPAAVVLIAWWKRGRVRPRPDVLPALPFLALASGLCLVTAWMEKNHVKAQGADWALSFPERWLIAGRALGFYLGKLLWPAHLCFLYPRWQLDPRSPAQWLWPIGAAAVLAGLLAARRRIGRGPAAAALYFAGALLPVLGFLNAYFMRYSFVCDHWTYLPSLGPIALGAALLAAGAKRLRAPGLLFGFAAVALPLLAIQTRRQSATYASMETLWRTTLAKNPHSALAHNNLGNEFHGRGDLEGARRQYQAAVADWPDFAEARYNLGTVLFEQGRTEAAIPQLEKAFAIEPRYAQAHNNLGNALLQQGKEEEALAQYRQALAIQPGYGLAHFNYGRALIAYGDRDGAIAQFRAAVAIQPDFGRAHYNLGELLLHSGAVDEAVEHLRLAARYVPADADFHKGLGMALFRQGRTDEAAAQFARAAALAPSDPEAHNDLGIAWGQLGRTAQAMAEYRAALALDPKLSQAHYNLGHALRAAGRREEAVAEFRAVLALRPGDADAARELQEMGVQPR